MYIPISLQAQTPYAHEPSRYAAEADTTIPAGVEPISPGGTFKAQHAQGVIGKRTAGTRTPASCILMFLGTLGVSLVVALSLSLGFKTRRFHL